MEFITLSATKYKQDLSKQNDTSRVLKKNERDNFYLESNFFISEVFHSGKILFNDTIGIYLNQIADRLLAKQPELRKQIRVYVIMSEVPNAFTGDNGAIFVSIGLISLCENEAQLAFVLAHEIIHFQKRHVMKQYMNDLAIDKGNREEETQDDMLAKANYSQEQESEADKLGLTLLVNAGYPAIEGVYALRWLDYYYLPFKADTAFTPQMLNSGQFNFNNHLLPYWEIDTALKYGEFEHEKEAYETHPEIKSRCEELLKLSGKSNYDTASRYSVSERFKKIQRIARYELCHLYLLSGHYQSAIYAATMLMTGNPQSGYLNEIIAKALYGYAMHNLNRKDGNSSKEKIGPEVYRVHLFMRSLEKAELCLLSMSWNLKMYIQTSGKNYFTRTRDLATTLMKKYKEWAVVDTTDDAIQWLIDDSSAITEMCIKECARMNSDENAKKVFASVNGKYNSEPRYDWDTKVKGEYALGIDTLIVLEPFYYRFQPLKKEGYEYKFVASEKGMKDYNQYIMKCGEAAEMQLNILSPYAMDSLSTDSFLDMAMFKSYFEARSRTLDSGLVSADAEHIDSLCIKYNTEQIAIMGEFSVHTHRKKIGLIIASIILWPTLPLGIAYAVTPTFDSYNYVAVYDIPSGQRYDNVHYIRQRDTRAGVSSSLYYNLLQIRNKK